MVRLNPDTLQLIATFLSAVGVAAYVLSRVQKMMDGVRLELSAKIDAVNQRIDAVLLADRKPT